MYTWHKSEVGWELTCKAKHTKLGILKKVYYTAPSRREGGNTRAYCKYLGTKENTSYSWGRDTGNHQECKRQGNQELRQETNKITWQTQEVNTGNNKQYKPGNAQGAWTQGKHKHMGNRKNDTQEDQTQRQMWTNSKTRTQDKTTCIVYDKCLFWRNNGIKFLKGKMLPGNP